MLIAETQEQDPITVTANLKAIYYDSAGTPFATENGNSIHFTGAHSVILHAPKGATRSEITSQAANSMDTATAELVVFQSWSSTDSFLSINRDNKQSVDVGQIITINAIYSGKSTLYYDVYANGRTVWSGAVTGDTITFQATEQMVPKSKVVAYCINPNNEISADSLTFEVNFKQLDNLQVNFDKTQALPGDPVTVSIQTDQQSMIGLAIVDESVFALNRGRLNMQEVFDELEKIFMQPQAEEHPQFFNAAWEIFDDAGLQVVSSNQLTIPQTPWWLLQVPGMWRFGDFWEVAVDGVNGGAKSTDQLAEVQRIRQFFPETWYWIPNLLTSENGLATIELEAPDSITNWKLHAVSTSPSGLGIADSDLLVFQEFFGEPDLPYAVSRGERFPVRVQIYNYLDSDQDVYVQLAEAPWFTLLDTPAQWVKIPANSVGSASFTIEPQTVGVQSLQVTLQSILRADAVKREIIVEPEGTPRELVSNGVIKTGQTISLNPAIPDYSVPDSQKLLLAITPSLVAQSINGVEDLLGMPYGCGEQNMIFMAPDIEILRYLNATGQLIPEIRAKAEHFITCGYQRELTYRRQDGSFSAFGDQDDSGSLWLTAFVLDTFCCARDFLDMDATVLQQAAAWITSHQKADGSWEPIGFSHHKEMIGGMSGNYALTGFVAIALTSYDPSAPALTSACQYLTSQYTTVIDDPYSLAIAALALTRTGHPFANTIIDRLITLAISDEQGIHWDPHPIETTAYAALSLIETERPQANEAIKWLALQQNSKGGFGSTQDTVMALKALMTAARSQTRNMNLSIDVLAVDPDGLPTPITQILVNETNFDVLQTVELPFDASEIQLKASGSGETRYQFVNRYHVWLSDECVNNNMGLEVVYDTSQVEINDIVNVNATVRYLAPQGSSGMMIVDIGVPTGFAPVQDSLDSLIEQKIASRIEVAGRKVIVYLDNLSAGETRTFSFQVIARFPVRATTPDSKAYLYYEPETRAEYPGGSIQVFATRSERYLYKLTELTNSWLDENDSAGLINLNDLANLSHNWLTP